MAPELERDSVQAFYRCWASRHGGSLVAVGLVHLQGKAIPVSVRAWETQPPTFQVEACSGDRDAEATRESSW